VFLGRDRHILIFPIQNATIVNIVAFVSNRPISGPAPIWESEAWIAPGTREEMLSGWEDWSDDCQAILQMIERPNKWALHELNDLPTHAEGPVAIFGDAAAATLPHQGQGAGQAIESAYTLSSLLASPFVTRDNAHTALQVFNEIRYAFTSVLTVS
jgi:salicylate hydroxylase